MPNPLLGSLDEILSLGKSAIERIWPDPIKRAEEMRKLEELHQAGELARLDAEVRLMLAQIEVNKIEAQHKSLFVAGWRPAIGWTGAIALIYQFVLYPLLLWIWAILQLKQIIPIEIDPPPVMETGTLFTIITGMLGIGAMRSMDKRAGVQTDSL